MREREGKSERVEGGKREEGKDIESSDLGKLRVHLDASVCIHSYMHTRTRAHTHTLWQARTLRAVASASSGLTWIMHSIVREYILQ